MLYHASSRKYPNKPKNYTSPFVIHSSSHSDHDSAESQQHFAISNFPNESEAGQGNVVI